MPRLTSKGRERLCSMVQYGHYTLSDMAFDVGCSITTVARVRDRWMSSRDAGWSRCGGGKRPLIPQHVSHALQRFLFEHSDRYLEEMQIFLAEEFGVFASVSAISRTLARMRWTNKITRRVARERNQDLRDFYMYRVSQFRSWQLVFIDESSCDKLAGVRKRGWAPRGVTPVQVANFHRGKRYQILPAYTQNGVIFSKIYSRYQVEVDKQTLYVVCFLGPQILGSSASETSTFDRDFKL